MGADKIISEGRTLIVVFIMMSVGVFILGQPNTEVKVELVAEEKDCTKSPGYNPDGLTDDARYPDNTWAGSCYDHKMKAEEEKDCTKSPGYNPDGLTDDARYPDNTWAGSCYKNKQM